MNNKPPQEDFENVITRFMLRVLLICLLLGLVFLGIVSTLEAAPRPTQWSLAGVASWAQPLTASGTALPATSSFTIGDLFIVHDTASATWFRLSATGWAPMGVASTSAGVSTLAGDVTGAADANTVVKIQGESVADQTPAEGEVLTYTGGSWRPSTSSGSGVTSEKSAQPWLWFTSPGAWKARHAGTKSPSSIRRMTVFGGGEVLTVTSGDGETWLVDAADGERDLYQYDEVTYEMNDIVWIDATTDQQWGVTKTGIWHEANLLKLRGDGFVSQSNAFVASGVVRIGNDRVLAWSPEVVQYKFGTETWATSTSNAFGTGKQISEIVSVDEDAERVWAVCESEGTAPSLIEHEIGGSWSSGWTNRGASGLPTGWAHRRTVGGRDAKSTQRLGNLHVMTLVATDTNARLYYDSVATLSAVVYEQVLEDASLVDVAYLGSGTFVALATDTIYWTTDGTTWASAPAYDVIPGVTLPCKALAAHGQKSIWIYDNDDVYWQADAVTFFTRGVQAWRQDAAPIDTRGVYGLVWDTENATAVECTTEDEFYQFTTATAAMFVSPYTWAGTDTPQIFVNSQYGPGPWAVSLTVSFKASADETFEVSLFDDGEKVESIGFTAKAGASADDLITASANGIVMLTDTSKTYDVRVACTSASSKTFTTVKWSLSMRRLGD